jgi:hypothetical protein
MPVRRDFPLQLGPTPTLVSWCIDDDTRHNVVARRNVLAAFWAGRLMGLSGAALSGYAAEVHFSDFIEGGDADIVDKITKDLHRSGLAIAVCEVRALLSACHREALQQTHVTD